MLSVIIPVYNEVSTIREILNKVAAVDVEKEIIVVDDCSSDGTRDILKEISAEGGAAVYFHEVNKGKGAAIRTGLGHVNGDVVVIQDADLEYEPEEFLRLIKPIQSGRAKVVYGSRFTGEHRNMFFWHMLGNKVLTLVTNVLYDTTLSDMETCYKMFHRDVILGLKLRANRFDFEPEVTAKVLKAGYRIYETPISYYGREFDEGKKISWKDAFPALWALIKYRFID
ncbi:MAG: glycosyltransferase family 2 protein [Chloroflexi bacterium]|nr:glycosyltransferase family 2 protein [Chloroflexota bacterium]